MTRWLVTASVAVNLLLLTTIVTARVDLARSRAVEALAPPVGAASPDANRALETSTSVAELYAALRSGGVSHAAARPLIGAWLSRQQREALRRELVPYWRARDPAATAARADRFEQEASTRRELTSLFGEGAARDPYFAVLFEPLGPRFSFLTPAEQETVQRALVAADFDGDAAPGSCATAAASASGLIDHAEGLSGAAAFEYGLRASPLATQLRHAGLELTEAEFRGAFGLMAELARGSTLAGHVSTRRALSELLGEARFDRLWSRRDPVYAEARRVLGGLGHSRGTIDRAYAVMNRAQERLLAAAEGMGDPERLGEVARGIAQEEQLGLEGIVGAAATRALLAARARLGAVLALGGDC